MTSGAGAGSRTVHGGAQDEEDPVGPLADRGAFRELYRSTAPEIYAYARRRVGHHEAEDITAETYVRAWRSRHTYRANGRAPIAWLTRIAQRVMIDRAAVTARNRVRASPDRSTEYCPPDTAGLDSVVLALTELPVRQREVLYRRFLLDESVDQVAASMDLTAEGVRALTYRAMRQLRNDPTLPAPAATSNVASMKEPA